MSKLDTLNTPKLDEYLVVMPHHPDKYGDIRLTLRLWRKYCMFNYYFIVIGDYDKSLIKEFPWVHFIYCKRVMNSTSQYTPHLDMQNKYRIIYEKYKDKYKGFIRVMDDHYAIKPFSVEDILTIHYHSDSFTGNKDNPVSYWNHDMWKTRCLLDKENLPCKNYSTHFPFYFEFEKIKELQNKYRLLSNSYCLESLYFNYFSHEKPVLDSSIRHCIHKKRRSIYV